MRTACSTNGKKINHMQRCRKERRNGTPPGGRRHTWEDDINMYLKDYRIIWRGTDLTDLGCGPVTSSLDSTKFQEFEWLFNC
jgi:hypothetical protein